MRNLAIKDLDSMEWLQLYRAYFVKNYPSVDLTVVAECLEDAADRHLFDDYPNHPEAAVDAEVASWTPP